MAQYFSKHQWTIDCLIRPFLTEGRAPPLRAQPGVATPAPMRPSIAAAAVPASRLRRLVPRLSAKLSGLVSWFIPLDAIAYGALGHGHARTAHHTPAPRRLRVPIRSLAGQILLGRFSPARPRRSFVAATGAVSARGRPIKVTAEQLASVHHLTSDPRRSPRSPGPLV